MGMKQRIVGEAEWVAGGGPAATEEQVDALAAKAFDRAWTQARLALEHGEPFADHRLGVATIAGWRHRRLLRDPETEGVVDRYAMHVATIRVRIQRGHDPYTLNEQIVAELVLDDGRG